MSEVEKLNKAVDDFADAMKARLIRKLSRGYKGWDDPNCRCGILLGALKDMDSVMDNDHVRKHCVDIADRLMMIWNMEANS